MTFHQNPFVDLYVTESISADVFVKVFSTVLFDEADTLALYQPGNVLLIGLQGSGKTALLNLLKPEVFIAYQKSGVKWPLPDHCARFLSAGINLSKSGAMDFGQRDIEPEKGNGERRFALYFADFLNYWIVDDLLQSVEVLSSASVPDNINFHGINASKESMERFTKALIQQRCWLGTLDGVIDYASLRRELGNRIIAYRNFLNYNTDELPENVMRSKTSIGEPISTTVDILRTHEVIPSDLPILIRIDQFEDLMGLEESESQALNVEYRAVVFKMLGMRDSRLSYRIGARPYAVKQNFKMLGTNSVIEELRNYTIIDIDSILRRKEHSKGLFPKFAEDVFEKRLRQSEYLIPNIKQSLITYVFGSKPSADQRAKNYVKDSAEGVFTADPSWPETYVKFMSSLAKIDPVSSKLGEAWIRQQIRRTPDPFPDVSLTPWEKDSRKWWRKERVELALLQIAAARKQRMLWAGDKDILSLSGGNILVFLSTCQLIWAEHLRSSTTTQETPLIHSHIVQDLGIQQASEYWYRKLRADPNGGDDRHRFISVLAVALRTGLRDDKRMSYPGANGFSLSDRDLETDNDIGAFLDMCVAYGALTVGRHTPKTSTRGESKKWYLFPILSPYFQLPVAHTKEPLYTNLQQIKTWLEKAQVLIRHHSALKLKNKSTLDNEDTAQLSLFNTITPKLK